MKNLIIKSEIIGCADFDLDEDEDSFRITYINYRKNYIKNKKRIYKKGRKFRII